LRWFGAAYLIYLGYKLWTSNGDFVAPEKGKEQTSKQCFWQGFLVVLSNPKVLVFLGAFFPQFIDPTGNAVAQTFIFGVLFSIYAILVDGLAAFFASKLGKALTQNRVRMVEKISGSALIAGGLLLAVSGTKKVV